MLFHCGNVLRRGFGALLIVLASASAATADTDAAQFWSALKSGNHFAIMRHALAPGTGDPSNFDVNDCTTQRNLSDEGRRQAAKAGAMFRGAGITSAKVYSSQWCRCLETARLMDLGPVTPQPMINSFFANSQQRQPQTEALQTWLKTADLSVPVLLVTHQVNISALSGVYPQSGELVLMKRESNGTFSVAARLRTD